MKKFVVYEVCMHPQNNDDFGLEKLAEFSSRKEAEEYTLTRLHCQLLIEEEGPGDEHEDMWNDPYGLWPLMNDDAD